MSTFCQNTLYYGFDIGGSKIAFGVYDDARNLLWEKRIPTPHSNYKDFLSAIITLVQEADFCFSTKGLVGIGIPGLPQTQSGVLYAANLPAACGRPLKADLTAELSRDVRMDNDANCFTLSEAWDDEFCQFPVVMGLILGTGVGGGIVVDGKTLSGRHFMTGEFGHMRLPVDALNVLGRDIPLTRCGCGQSGCIENYLSGRGFAWLYHHFYHRHMNAETIIERYRQGETQAVVHVERFMELLAVCMGNFLTVIDAHLVVIGGGLSHFTEIYQQLPQRLSKYMLPVATPPRIEPARHGDAGGMRGAAFLHLVK